MNKLYKIYCMTGVNVSIVSIVVNLILAIFKIVTALITGSASVLAEAVHSSLDIISSLVTFLGIKTAKRPSTETHKYGFYSAEVLAGAVVALLLAVTGGWIIYEGVDRFLLGEVPTYSYFAIGLMAASIIINEIMARVKFSVGNKEESISLVADGEHSRADVISSVGVLIALLLTPYIASIDSIVAIVVGGYVLYEAYQIGREATFSLMDVADQEAEDQIKKIVESKKIALTDLKTRKMGAVTFAELKIQLDPKLSVEQANAISRDLESVLNRKISRLKQIAISIEARELTTSTIFTDFGAYRSHRGGFEIIGPEKKGRRVVIPIHGTELAEGLGVEKYLIIDEDKEGRILQKETMKNPYFDGSGHGIKFLKNVRADKVLAMHIGENAIANLKSKNIDFELIKEVPEKYR